MSLEILQSNVFQHGKMLLLFSVLVQIRENSAVAKYLLLFTVFSTQSFYVYVHLACKHSYTLNNRCIEDNSANYKATRSAVVELRV